jgi:hypothetical protein
MSPSSTSSCRATTRGSGGSGTPPAELRETHARAERLGPFGHVFKSLSLLDRLPEEERALYLSDFAPTLAACAAAAG